MTAAVIAVGLLFLGLALGTYLLQAMILLLALVIQIAGWILTGLIGGGYMLWLALTDRRELARVWRAARPAPQSDQGRRIQSFG